MLPIGGGDKKQCLGAARIKLPCGVIVPPWNDTTSKATRNNKRVGDDTDVDASWRALAPCAFNDGVLAPARPVMVRHGALVPAARHRGVVVPPIILSAPATGAPVARRGKIPENSP